MKMRPPSNDIAVQGTNDSSIVSKRSMERVGYVQETQYLRYMVKKTQRRAPLINRGYYLRSLAINYLLDQFLCSHANERKVVVNLGCGFDPTFFRLKSRRIPYLTYIDLDFPDLVVRKRDLILNTPELASLLSNLTASSPDNELHTEDYILLGCDLRDLPNLERRLRNLGIDGLVPTFFLAEVVLTYMGPDESDALLAWACQFCSKSTFAIYEQIIPSPTHPFAKTMLAHFRALSSPLLCVDTYPTLRSQAERFRRLGWKDFEAIDVNLFWNSVVSRWMPSERGRVSKIENFDEWEEIHVAKSFYFVGVARAEHTCTKYIGFRELLELDSKERGKLGSSYISMRSTDSSPQKHPSITSSQLPDVPLKLSNSYSLELPNLHRRGHTMNILRTSKGQALVIFGGFGKRLLIKSESSSSPTSPTSHSRLNDTIILDLSSLAVSEILKGPLPKPRMYHTATTLINEHQLLIFGGRDGPNKAFDDTWILNVQTGTWEILPIKGPVPTARFRHSACLVQCGRAILVTGGIGAAGSVLSDIWLLDLQRREWTEVQLESGISVLGPRHSHSATTLGDSGEKVLIIGGLDSFENVLASMIELDLSSRCAVEITYSSSEPEINFPSRYGHIALSLPCNPSILLLVGGVSLPDLLSWDDTFIALDPVAQIWFRVRISEPSSRHMYVGHAACVTLDNSLYVSGGGMTCFSFGGFWDQGIQKLQLLCNDEKEELIQPVKMANRTTNDYQLSLKEFKGPTSGKTPAEISETALWNTPLEIPRVRCETSQDWDHIYSYREPVVIEGLDFGACVELWTPEYLKQSVGDKKITIHACKADHLDFHKKNFDFRTITFSDFVDKVCVNNDETSQADANTTSRELFYLRSISDNPRKNPTHLHADFPSLAVDFQIPQQLTNTISPRYHSSPLRMSSERIALWTHYDVTDNVLFQVRGEKRIRLWTPKEVDLLYVVGSSSQITDVDQPDLKRFPRFARSHPRQTILKPGDAIFIPSLWLHHVLPLSPAVSINVFWRNWPDDYYDHGRDLYGNKDLKEFARGAEGIDKIVAGLCTLPNVEKEFYGKKLVMQLIQGLGLEYDEERGTASDERVGHS